MKSALLKRWFHVHPQASPGAFTRLVRDAGWHGVLGEMFEERVGDATKAALGLQAWDSVIPSPEQLLVEAVSFSIPGAAGAAAKAAVRRIKSAPASAEPNIGALQPPSPVADRDRSHH